MNEAETTVTTSPEVISNFITADDITMIFGTIILISALAWLITRLIVFVPEFMRDLVKKVKNPSPIYSKDTIHEPTLEPTLDKSEFGIKTLIDRWF